MVKLQGKLKKKSIENKKKPERPRRSVTGTSKQVERSVAQSGGIVLQWFSGYVAGG